MSSLDQQQSIEYPATTSGESSEASAKMVAETQSTPYSYHDLSTANETPSSVPDLEIDFGVDPIDTTTEDTPESTEVADEVPVQQLDEETINEYAQELHGAINRQNNGVLGIGGGNDPDTEKIFNLLDNLTEADRRALEEAYKETPGNTDHHTLDDELRNRLGDTDYRKVEAQLNRKDGSTNDAGNLMVALTTINDDRGDGERKVLETFATLNTEQQKQLEEDFQNNYGMSVDDALKQYDLSEEAMNATTFLRKPVDQRTSEDIKEFANYAIDQENLDYFGIALRGNTPAAVQAREELTNDPEFVKKVAETFQPDQDGGVLGTAKNIVSKLPGGDIIVGGVNLIQGIVEGDLSFDQLTEGTNFDMVRQAVSSKQINSEQLQALDILQHGHVSLATIALDNTGTLFGWFDNKEAIGNAANNATENERALYSQGYEIAQKGEEPQNEEEQKALDFYNLTHKAFEDAGSEEETAKWEDKLLNGNDGSVISGVAEAGDINGRFTAVEDLSEADWQRLKDPETGAAFREQIDKSLSSFTESGEHEQLMALLDEKIAADSFEDSQAVVRSISDVIEHNEGHAFLVFGTGFDGKNITEAITEMSPEDAERYENDPAFKQELDTFVSDNLNSTEQALSRRVLDQVAETGIPPELDATGRVLQDKINGVELKDSIGNIEELLQDEGLRERLSSGENLSPEEKALKDSIESHFIVQVSGGKAGTSTTTSPSLETLYEQGRLPVDEKAKLGLKTDELYIEASTVAEDERQQLFDQNHISEDEKQLIEVLSRQNGEADLADRLRSFVIGDGTEAGDFVEDLKALSPQEKQELKDNYESKYDSPLDQDVLSKVSEDERNNFRTYLSAHQSDGRQDYYDNLERALTSESGFSPDGSQEVVDRSLTDNAALLTDFQARFEELPPEKQEQANKYFNEALEDYQKSKEAFAEKLYQAAVIVGGVAVGGYGR